VVTHQLQVERRTGKVRRPETDVLPLCQISVSSRVSSIDRKKDSPYLIAERRVPELIPVLGSQPASDASHKPGGRLPLLSARPPARPSQPLGVPLPISLLGEQRYDGCEQFA